MTVTLTSLAARAEDEIAVSFEIKSGDNIQKETFLVSSALVADLRLCKGETTRECFDAVAQGALIHRAVKRGLGILAYGACSERTLCQKLVIKGTDREIAQQAVLEIKKAGYLDSDADALREAEKCIAKLWGKRRIVATLFSKGYEERAVKSAMYSLEDNGVYFPDVCAERIRRFTGEIPEDRAQREKLIASLIRYGFDRSEIREAFSLVAED